jgi:hypothetical protein
MNDILEIVKRYEGDEDLGEMATEFGDTKSMDSYHQEENEDPPAAGETASRT